MKHYLKPGDEVQVNVMADVEYNGPDGFTITEVRDLEPNTVYIDGHRNPHEVKWDDDGYYWED